MPEQPQLAPFDLEQAAILLHALSSTISMADPSHPTEETQFGRLYLQSNFFGHYPEVMTIGKGWNIDCLVNRKLYLMAQLSLLYKTSLQNHVTCTKQRYNSEVLKPRHSLQDQRKVINRGGVQHPL